MKKYKIGDIWTFENAYSRYSGKVIFKITKTEGKPFDVTYEVLYGEDSYPKFMLSSVKDYHAKKLGSEKDWPIIKILYAT